MTHHAYTLERGLFATRSYLTTNSDIRLLAGALYHYGEFAHMKAKQRKPFRESLQDALKKDEHYGYRTHTLQPFFEYYQQYPDASRILFNNLEKDGQPYLGEVLGNMIARKSPGQHAVFDPSRATDTERFFLEMRTDLTTRRFSVMDLFEQSVSTFNKAIMYPFKRTRRKELV